MRREACNNLLFTKVVREAGQFVAGYSGVDQQYAGPASHHDGVVLEQFALVDQHAVRNLPQHQPASFRIA
jgi:hypothetical protein